MWWFRLSTGEQRHLDLYSAEGSLIYIISYRLVRAK